MYSTSTCHTSGGVKPVVDTTVSNLPRSPRHWRTTTGFRKVEEKSFIKGRVEYSTGPTGGARQAQDGACPDWRSSGMTYLPKSSIEVMTWAWGIVSVAIRNCN